MANGLSEADCVEIIHPSIAVSRIPLLGAVWGVVAWSAYALVEYLTCSIWPLFTIDQAVFSPLNWRLTAWLFNAYWVLGAIAGLVCVGVCYKLAAAAPDDESRRNVCRRAGAIGLYAAILLHLLTGPPMNRGTVTSIALASSLLLVTLWGLLRPHTRLAPWATLHPLLASFLIIGTPWLPLDVVADRGPWERRLASALVVAVVIAGGWWFHRFRSWSATRHMAANLALVGIVITASAALSGRNRELPVAPQISVPDPGLTPVVLLSFDTTRADHMSVYGYSRRTTPHLEEFAREATTYTDLVASGDMTLSSHGSIFTGLYPSWHGAHSYSANPLAMRPLDRGVTTLAETLSERGIFTAGVAANNAFLLPEWGLTQGFQSFDVQTPVPLLPAQRRFYLRRGIRRLLSCCFETTEFDAVYRPAQEVTNDAIGIMEQQEIRRRTFFLFVNYMDAHSPFVAQVPRGVALPQGYGAPSLVELRDIQARILARQGQFTEQQRRVLLERYDAGIAQEDAAFADLIAWLKRRGLYDRALIIVTADHGEAFGEHSLADHGAGLYQHQIHVPLLIKYPHQKVSRVVAHTVAHVDLLPTILDVLHLPIPSKVQGVSLLNAAAEGKRMIFSESFPTRLAPFYNPRFDRVEHGARFGDYKLVLSTNGKHELFDLSSDPAETHNLSATPPPVALEMEKLLHEWVHAIPVTHGTRMQTDEQLRRLKGLGYVR